MMKVKDKIEALAEELCNTETYIKLSQILTDAAINSEYKKEFLNNGKEYCPYMNCTDKYLNTYKNEKFKWYQKTKSTWHYYVSDIGRVLLYNKKVSEYKISEKNDYYIIPLCQGKSSSGQEESYLYLDTQKFKQINPQFKDLSLNNTTPIHEMVVEAFNLKANIKNDDIKYEIHHINNCGFDNRLDNLIYLRKSLHALAHELKNNK